MQTNNVSLGIALTFISILVLSTIFKNSAVTIDVKLDIERLTEENLLTGLDPVALASALDWATEGTSYEQNWDVNAPIQSDKLNVYIVDTNSWNQKNKDRYSYLPKNAVADRTVPAILLDYSLIEKLDNTYSEDKSWGTKAIYLAWIVAHEVGHIELGHGQSHFMAGFKFLEQITPQFRVKKREIEADKYFINMITNSNSELSLSCSAVMLELIRNSPKVESKSNSHPSYIDRAIFLVERVANEFNDKELLQELKNTVERHSFNLNE
jgi:hypothetical protein